MILAWRFQLPSSFSVLGNSVRRITMPTNSKNEPSAINFEQNLGQSGVCNVKDHEREDDEDKVFPDFGN